MEVNKTDSSIAWFKLSQLVSRGEKEKALGLYKLLSYSLEDKAYALQVEADLLWAFSDSTESAEKYKQAAFLYKKDHKIVSAAGVYEHLLELDPESYEAVEALIECYARLDWYEKIQQRCDQLIELSEKNVITHERLMKTLKLAAETYKFDKNEKALKRFITFLKSKNKEIAAYAKVLA